MSNQKKPPSTAGSVRTTAYTDIQLKTFIHGIEVFNMKITMRWERLRQRRNLSDERI